MTFDRVWVHQGNGHWIGSCIMCFAQDEVEAGRLIREALDEAGLKDEPLNLRWHRADVAGIFHRDDGDY